MAVEHDLILEYIRSLPVDSRVSVRNIAEELSVSEGTVHRVIKNAENVGPASTTQRVGTTRIERKLKGRIERLTFGKVVRIIEGDVLGGSVGLNRVLNEFVVGAMTKYAAEHHTIPGSLMIVGNRAEVQELALEDGATVLIIRGFNTTTEIAKLTGKLEMPILCVPYDTFTAATMISRVLSSQLIEKDIMFVSDIYMPAEKTHYLHQMDTISDYQRLSKETQHSCFPAVNRHHRSTEVVTAKNVLGKPPNQIIGRVVTKEPISTKKTMSIASASH